MLRFKKQVAFYDYLAAVFELCVRLRRTKQAKKTAKLIAKLFDFHNQKPTHPIRVIIDATSTADNKTRSRWTRALRYAWRERKAWTEILNPSCVKTAGLLGAGNNLPRS